MSTIDPHHPDENIAKEELSQSSVGLSKAFNMLKERGIIEEFKERVAQAFQGSRRRNLRIMSVLLNNDLNLNRMQAAASAWQFSDPHFQYYLDTASRLLYGGSASSLTPSDRRTLGHMLATVQNHHPDVLGNPIADPLQILIELF